MIEIAVDGGERRRIGDAISIAMDDQESLQPRKEAESDG